MIILPGLADDRQVIVVENSDPPTAITARPQVVMFSKNPHSGRYGFFPMEPETNAPTDSSETLESEEGPQRRAQRVL